jgi:hypothetical protein|tara:strand:+ start:1384 stop:1644 length:261 start_codon:yes stop_codon:yes gene_type:complete
MTLINVLLDMLDGAEIPLQSPEEGAGDQVRFPLGYGWSVVVFYDCGDFDYIDHFERDIGNEPTNSVDFWEWPDCDEQELLRNWQPT